MASHQNGSGGGDPKSSRFGKRKQKRAGKRTRSDGFVLGVEVVNSDEEESQDLHGGPDPEALNWLLWLRNPTVQNLARLRRAIKTCDSDWMREFLEFDGLGLVFQCLKNLSDFQSSHLTDMVLRMEAASCIREVVNSQSGLDCLLSLKSKKDNLFGRRFATALETNNVMVKLQMFELLSALCLYSRDGFYLTLDALEMYKKWKKLPYRFSLLVNEMDKADLTTYKTTVMALVNSIIVANENIRERVRIRNEFIALNIQEIIQRARYDEDKDLQVQLDVFEEELSADADALEEMTQRDNIDISQPGALFQALHKKVQDSPLAMSLLGILYNLYQLDANSPHSEGTWLLLQRLTAQAVDSALEAEQAVKQVQQLTCRRCERAAQTEDGELRAAVPSSSRLLRRSGVFSGRASSATRDEAVGGSHGGIGSGGAPPPPPPPPPFLPAAGLAPPPPAPPPPLSPGLRPPPPAPPMSPGLAPPVPPPPPLSPGAPPPPLPPPSPGGPAQLRHVAPPEVKPIKTPSPSVRMKTFTWNKLPPAVVRQSSVWGEVNKMRDSISVEYDRLEELFAQKTAPALPDKVEDQKVLKRQSATMEVTLLDAKRSMNLNIFLKQFRKTNEEIVELIRKGDHRAIGSEKLKGLIKLLPPAEEVELLQSYEGDQERLGGAERFLLTLLALPAYALRLEAMMARAELPSQLSTIRPHISLVNSICRCLYDNASLKKFLRLVLHAGNFINQGSNAGEASGFRISSLNKLAMTKSNNPRLTLLHVLVEEAMTQDPNALRFVDDLLDDLQKASRTTVESVRGEFTQVKNSIKRLQREMESVNEEVRAQFKEFLEEAESDLGDVEEGFQRITTLSKRLAAHFCENENTFSIDEFINIFKEFCEKVKACEQEVESRKQQAEKAEMRKKAQEEILEKRRSARMDGTASLPPGQSAPDKKIVDNLVNEIKRGNVLRRLSVKRKTNLAVRHLEGTKM